jgi:hypothetical protein
MQLEFAGGSPPEEGQPVTDRFIFDQHDVTGANLVEHASQRSSGVCTVRKPKNAYFVPGVIYHAAQMRLFVRKQNSFR